MPARITHDIVATIGQYKDRQTGEDKKRYITIGKCFTDDQGRQSIKLDAVPVSPEWSGWISLYPIKERDGAPPPQSRQPAPRSTPAAAAQPIDTQEEDDIPF